MPRRKPAKPTRDFERCQRCGYLGLYWAPKSTREVDKPLDKNHAICLDRSGRPDEFDVHAHDGYYDAMGWKAEGKQVAGPATEDGVVFKAAPIHECDPRQIERWQHRDAPAIPALSGQDRAAGEG